jgi:two-component system C4-dicarboxylate transport response regulator DctD
LAILELRGDSVRALVSDISMPHLSGLDLAAIVKGRWPYIGIVLASAYPPADLRERMPKGALFLEKPYKGMDLLTAVQFVLGAERLAPGPAVRLHNFPLQHRASARRAPRPYRARRLFVGL